MKFNIISMLAILAFPFAAHATEYRTVERPKQKCWNEQVQAPAQHNYTGAVVGGLAGGLLGNQIGSGSGRAVATAAGVVGGAYVGDRIASGGTRYTTVQRCRTVMERVRVPVDHGHGHKHHNKHNDKHHNKHHGHNNH